MQLIGYQTSSVVPPNTLLHSIKLEEAYKLTHSKPD